MHPFAGSVDEVPLKRAPLVSVICQVRFPEPVNLDDSAIETTKKTLASDYPIARRQAETVVVVGPNGVSQQPGNSTSWALSSAGEKWRVVLGREMVSIEASKYESRGDFIKRLTAVLEAVESTYNPPICDRIGVRYVNRIDDPNDLADLDKLVKPVALAGLQVPRNPAMQIQHSLSDTVFVDDLATIRARWGWLPAGAVIDPGLPSPSRDHWMLDLDVFRETPIEFGAASLARQAELFSEKAYLLFRWLVTEEFVNRFKE